MTVSQHPPADRRCQIYVDLDGTLLRCVNLGTHWQTWGGCDDTDHDGHFCEGEMFSWECAGPCVPSGAA